MNRQDTKWMVLAPAGRSDMGGRDANGFSNRVNRTMRDPILRMGRSKSIPRRCSGTDSYAGRRRTDE
jgi:hypothetical protein